MKKQKLPATDSEILRQKAESVLKKKVLKKSTHLTKADTIKLIHELEVHQIELEMQNEELAQSKTLALEVAKEKYAELYDFAPSAYFSLSREGEILELNLFGSQILGKERSLLKNSMFGFFISNDTRPIFNLFLESLFNGNTAETCEVTLSVNPISPVYVHLTGILTDEGEQCLITVTDITRRREAEEALRESEERLRTITRNAPNIIMELDKHGRILYINHDLPGYKLENVIGEKFWDWIPSEYHAESMNALEFVFSNALPQSFQSRSIGSNGEMYWYQCNLSPVVVSGSVENAILIISDITERIKADERRYEILQTAIEGFWVLDINGYLLEVNKTYSVMSGYHIPELLTMHISDLEVDDKEEDIIVRIQNVKLQGEDCFESRHRRKDGSIFDVQISIQYQPIDGGQLVVFLQDITERKLAQNALMESERMFRKYIDHAPHGIFVANEKGQYIDVNLAASIITGYDKEELFSLNLLDLTHEDSREKAKQHFIRVISDGFANGEFTFVRKDGSNGIWSVDAVKLSDKIFLGFVVDITSRKQTEAALLENERLLRESQAVANIGSFSVDLINKTWKASVEMYEIFGIDDTYPNTLVSGLNRIHPDFRERLTTDLFQIDFEKKPFDHEYKIIRFNDGQERWVQGLGKFEFDQQKNRVRLIGTIQDITNRKHAQEELFTINKKIQESVYDLNKAESVAHLGHWKWNIETSEVTWSDQMFQVFGIEKSSYSGRLGDAISKVIHPDDLHLLLPANAQSFTNQKPIEYRIVMPDNSIRHIASMAGESIFDNDGKIIHLTGIAQDITARKQVEEVLRESEYFFRESQQAAFIGSYKTDFTTGLWESSEVMDQIFGIDNTYIKSLEGWLNIMHPDDREMMNQYLMEEVIEKRSPFNKEYRIIRINDGEMRWIHGIGRVGFDKNNNLNSLFGTIQDITERKTKEEYLRKLNQTMAALSKSSMAMSQALDEADYLNQVCKIVVDDTDFAMVWIGFAEEDEEKTIRMMASAGFNNDYLQTIKLSWGDNEFGTEPTGVAIRTGNIGVCNSLLTDPKFKPLRQQALKHGYASSIVFPLKSGNKTFGAISIFSKEPDSFQVDEIKLLSKLANDLAQGVTTLRLRAAHQLAEEALVKSHAELEELVVERTQKLEIANDLLLQEINIRKEQEQTLRLTEEKYRTVADFTTNWEFWISPSDQMIYCSPSCERITGYSVPDFVVNPQLLFDIIHPEDLPMYLEHKKQEMQTQACLHEIRFRIFRKDGAIRWIGHFCQPVFDESGHFKGIRGSNKDINARKKGEELLKKSNLKHSLLSANITDGIFIIRDGCFEYVNRAMSHIFGYQRTELIGFGLNQLILPEYANELEFIQTAHLSNQKRNVEIECVKKDRSIISIEFLFNYIATEKVIYGVSHDITEKKQIQKNIVKAIILTEEKERALFSKELHDGLGPLLSTIKLYLQWSERSKSNKSREEIILKAENILEDALTAVKEISNKLSPHLLINYGLCSAIHNFIDKLEETSAIRILFDCNIGRRLGDEIEAAVYRAIIECINNTIKHSGAKIVVINLHDNDNSIEIQYRDDGVGFDLDETLAVKKGLGLFNLQNRIQNIGGKITMFSKPGQGVYYQIIVNI